MKIFIGGAWIYANGSIHIGHVAGLITGDVIARYHRLKGDEVCYVSGSDAHGTPITVRAEKEGVTPKEIASKYHGEFCEDYQYLNVSFDHYGNTCDEDHKEFVKDFHKKLYESSLIYEKVINQPYCSECRKFLPDRLVIGVCPKCGSKSRGDQCDNCGEIFEGKELIEGRCSSCGKKPEYRESKQLYIALEKIGDQIQGFLRDKGAQWRENAVKFTERYINEGLRDRAITRDINWGIDVPLKEYENKSIYIWAENVLGYLSGCWRYNGKDYDKFKQFWNGEGIHYYVHGKDNIPFHSIILPGLLIANDDGYKLPDRIISSEYLTLEGKKISTSNDHAVWVKDIRGKINPDSLRYFLLINGPERRDSDFSCREFVNSNNGELLGAYGNLINRTLVFIKKSFDGKVPKGVLSYEIKESIEKLYVNTGESIEKGEFKKGLEQVFDFIRWSNKYFDSEQPWKTRKDDIEACENTLYNCVQIIANLAIILEPFIPRACEKQIQWFKLERVWKFKSIEVGYEIPEIDILFERLDYEKVLDVLYPKKYN